MPNRATRADSPHRLAASQLAGLLRDRRLRAGLSQQALAEAAGVAIATVRAIEGGRTVEPGLFTVHELTLALGMSLQGAVDRAIERAREDQEGEEAEEAE